MHSLRIIILEREGRGRGPPFLSQNMHTHGNAKVPGFECNITALDPDSYGNIFCIQNPFPMMG